MYLKLDKLIETHFWVLIESVVSGLDNRLLEYISCGDTNESSKLRVLRLIRDVKNTPIIENPNLTNKIIQSLNSFNFIKRIETMTGSPDLSIGRMQINVMEKGSFLGHHIDQESNPNFKYSVILTIKKNCSGGILILNVDNTTQTVPQSPRTGVLIDSSIPHEVSKLIDGDRVTLMIFIK